MPTYSYRCPVCEKIFEEWCSPSKRPEAIVCTDCNTVADRAIEGGLGFQLKGHGWGFDRYAGPSNFSFGKDNKND